MWCPQGSHAIQNMNITHHRCKKDVTPERSDPTTAFFGQCTPLDPWDLESDFRACYQLIDLFDDIVVIICILFHWKAMSFARNMYWNLLGVYLWYDSLWTSSFLKRFEGVESKTFVCRLISCPRNRLREHVAPLGGVQWPRGCCKASAVQKGCGGCQDQRWPGASKHLKQWQESSLQVVAFHL